MSAPRHQRALVRPHVVTGGRARPTRDVFDLVTLVSATDASPADLTAEKRRIVRFCRDGALSVAEVAGRLGLPVSVTKVLLSDLVDSGHIAAPPPPAPPAESSRIRLLQEVLDGLRAGL